MMVREMLNGSAGRMKNCVRGIVVAALMVTASAGCDSKGGAHPDSGVDADTSDASSDAGTDGSTTSCGGGTTIAVIDPPYVWNGGAFPTSFFGSGLGGTASMTVSQGAGAKVALLGVAAMGSGRVDAKVPGGLTPGVYDVNVVDGQGCSVTFGGALTVVGDVTVSVCGIDRAVGDDALDTPVTIASTATGQAGGATCDGRVVKFSSAPRAFLLVGSTLEPLENVGFDSSGSVGATVPPNLTVGGPYDLVVQNPDGSIGRLSSAFEVVANPAPDPTSVAPQIFPSNYAQSLTISGSNFRAPVTVALYGSNGVPVNVPSPVVASPNEIQIAAFDVGTLGLTTGAYLVRVTNTDDGSFGEYSAISILTSMLSPGAWTDNTSAALPVAVMRHGVAAGQTSLAARYVYVVGGDTGGVSPTRQTATRIGELDQLGQVVRWSTGRYGLPAARTELQLISIPAASGRGGYLYAVGGVTAMGLSSAVTRAKILLPEDAPVVTQSSVELGGALPSGSWFYRVSAVMGPSDATNPSGETLASTEVVVHAVTNSKVVLAWQAVSGAASYRVYRSSTGNGVSNTEVLLADAVPTTTYVDEGGATVSSESPLRRGEHGVWVPVASLNEGRRSLGLAVAHNSTGAAFLYAVGGDKAASGLPAALDVLSSYEYAALSNDGGTLGAWTFGAAAFSTARTRLQCPVGEHATSSSVAAGTAYVYVVGGWNGTAVVESYQPGTVQADGSLTWGSAVAATGLLSGGASIVATNQLFAFGGTNALGTPQVVARQAAYTTPPTFGSFSTIATAAADTSSTQSVASFAGLAHTTSRFHLLGGSVDGTNALDRVWTNTY